MVVYQNAQPWLIIECKNETEKLSPSVLSQLLSYVSVLPVKYLALSNGPEMFTYHVSSKKWQAGLPAYNSISE
ncbi:MAG: type I restriction enzyme HsdR N-terminal domain-containing protein [Bacteroidetes bacterium]|nr:type I restriction enzyme HsdR N-terminal domain-containing protein [Bacteroidota bacterium]